MSKALSAGFLELSSRALDVVAPLALVVEAFGVCNSSPSLHMALALEGRALGIQDAL